MNFTLSGVWQLAIETVTNPRDVGARLMATRFSMDALWTGLALVAILSTLLSEISMMLTPLPAEMAGILPPPILTVILLGGTLLITVISLLWCGRAMGGTGTLRDILVLMVWLQGVWVLVQLVILVISLVSAMLASIVNLAAMGAMLWVLLNFVAVGHGLASLWHAAGVLLFALFGIVVGVMILSSFIGVAPVGSGYV